MSDSDRRRRAQKLLSIKSKDIWWNEKEKKTKISYRKQWIWLDFALFLVNTWKFDCFVIRFLVFFLSCFAKEKFDRFFFSLTSCILWMRACVLLSSICVPCDSYVQSSQNHQNISTYKKESKKSPKEAKVYEDIPHTHG